MALVMRWESPGCPTRTNYGSCRRTSALPTLSLGLTANGPKPLSHLKPVATFPKRSPSSSRCSVTASAAVFVVLHDVAHGYGPPRTADVVHVDHIGRWHWRAVDYSGLQSVLAL